MFSFAKKWFGPKPCPIGVDFGTSALRLAQCVLDGDDWRLLAAASRAVPPELRGPNTLAAQRYDFFTRSMRDLLSQGGFVGRSVMIAMPSPDVHVCHVRTAVMSAADLAKALPWELKGKLPIDPSRAVLRHVIAGRVTKDNAPQDEVIVMASPRGAVEGLLAAASKAKLEVLGLNVDSRALVDCFGHVYRRKSDAEVTNCFIDLGCRGTRVTIARAGQVFFSRTIPLGGDDFTAAVAKTLGVTLEEARATRIALSASEETRALAAAAKAREFHQPEARRETPDSRPDEDRAEDAFYLPAAAREERRQDVAASAAPLPHSDALSVTARKADAAVAPLIARLVDELNLCRRYFEATFSGATIERLIFVGGEGRQRGLCRRIASDVGLTAQLGDPLVRMSRTTTVGIESGIDRRDPQPAWAVAVGLSMGPLTQANELAQAA